MSYKKFIAIVLISLVLFTNGLMLGCKPQSKSSTANTEQKVENKYWVNSNSNVRHNKSCRYYGTTNNGYYTDKPEGRGCKICGG